MDSGSDSESLAQAFEKQERRQLRSLLEAALFASPEPVTVRQLARALQESEERIGHLLQEITVHFESVERGIFIHQAGSGYRFGTKPQHQEELQEILRGLRPRAPLSVAALQTLAIIAYKQPISAPDIQAIRRVEGAGVLTTLRKRKLIAPAGHKKDRRSALLYKTTDLFLKDFGLPSLADLPALEEFAEIRF